MRGEAPVKKVLGQGLELFRPKDPGGEDAVEESLDQRGAKEMLAFFALESEAESLFKGFADAGKCGELVRTDASQCIARVGGEERCEVFWRCEWRGMKHDTPSVFCKCDGI